MKLPEHVPETGFYYHYKHDPNGSVNNYAYEVLSVGTHTEYDTDEDVDANLVYFVNYRPIYESAFTYKAGKEKGILFVDNRPIKMWLGQVKWNGKTMSRFTKITDSKIIAELEVIRNEMYVPHTRKD